MRRSSSGLSSVAECSSQSSSASNAPAGTQSGSVSRPSNTRQNHQSSLSAACLRSPPSVNVEGGCVRDSCSWVSPSVFISMVSRW